MTTTTTTILLSSLLLLLLLLILLLLIQPLLLYYYYYYYYHCLSSSYPHHHLCTMCLCVFCVGSLCGPPLQWWVLCGVFPSVWVPCGWGPPLSCSRFRWQIFLVQPLARAHALAVDATHISRYIGDGFPVPFITANLLDQWFGLRSFSQHVAGSTPGSVTFPSRVNPPSQSMG